MLVFNANSINGTLLYGTMLFLVVSLVVGILFLTDNTTLMGVNIWLKPLKFSISIAIFLFTSAFIIPLLPYGESKSQILIWVLIVTMLIEIACIVFQASRGQQSHFNITDPIGRIMFPLMGIAISITYLVYAILLYDFFALPTNLSPALLWSIRIGIIIFLFGGISGFLMVSGLKHNNGVPDGGIGLPFTNWSTIGGDLRVSHFFSLHAIQLLPLLTLIAYKADEPLKLKLVLTVGAIYAAFCVLTLIQALLGQPFIKLNN